MTNKFFFVEKNLNLDYEGDKKRKCAICVVDTCHKNDLALSLSFYFHILMTSSVFMIIFSRLSLNNPYLELCFWLIQFVCFNILCLMNVRFSLIVCSRFNLVIKKRRFSINWWYSHILVVSLWWERKVDVKIARGYSKGSNKPALTPNSATTKLTYHHHSDSV